MKYVLIPVVGARRNPDKNPKEDLLQEIKKYVDLDKSNKIPVYFASFVDLLKIGINPDYKYDTPIGIYCYPIRYIFKDYTTMQTVSVPFAQTRKYIQIIKRETDKVLSEQTVDFADKQTVFEKLKQFFAKKRKNLTNRAALQNEFGKSISSISNEEIFDYIEKGTNKQIRDYGLRNTAFAYIWNLTKNFSLFYKYGTLKTKNKTKKSIILWNQLLRYLGYDLVVDYDNGASVACGYGVIHPNEPCQAVFLTKQACELMQTVYNKRVNSDNTFSKHQYIEQLSKQNKIWYNNTVYDLTNLPDTVSFEGVEFTLTVPCKLPSDWTLKNSTVTVDFPLTELPEYLKLDNSELIVLGGNNGDITIHNVTAINKGKLTLDNSIQNVTVAENSKLNVLSLNNRKSVSIVHASIDKIILYKVDSVSIVNTDCKSLDISGVPDVRLNRTSVDKCEIEDAVLSCKNSTFGYINNLDNLQLVEFKNSQCDKFYRDFQPVDTVEQLTEK